MNILTTTEVNGRLAGLVGEPRQGDALQKEYSFETFPDAVACVDRRVPGTDDPTILIAYRRVTLTYSTHSEGGITEKDFNGAELADSLA